MAALPRPGGARVNAGALARSALRRFTGAAAAPSPVTFALDEAGVVCDAFFADGCGGSAAWQPWRDAHLALPAWFRSGLDPFGDAYAQQQQRLWQAVAGVERRYDAALHEKEHPWGDIDAVRSPGYFVRRDARAVAGAADHMIAGGMILKHGGVAAGDWALEYGAGFAQTALSLARLGVNVDTVDISQTFCGYVRQQADFFRVPLHPFHGAFGDRPRPQQRYKLVWFYESFHHCVDFLRVVPQLRALLAPGGRVVLAGEPVVEEAGPAVPYPWGLRLHSEVVAVVRKHHWFELGFTEAFLFELFGRAAFSGRRVDCEPSPFGRLYVFEPRPGV